MAIDPEETRARLERLLREADAGVPERPVAPEAPVLRARRAIRIRYAVIAVSFVALTIVLTAGAVFARDRLDRDDGPTGPTTTAPTGPTTTTPTVTPSLTVSITSGPEDATNVRKATFTFTLEGTDLAQCTLNGTLLGPCESGVTVDGAEGSNTFEVRAIGQDGEPGGTDRHTWTLDTVAPTVTLRSLMVVYTRGDSGATCSVADEPFPCDEPALLEAAGTEYFIATNGLGLSWTFDPMPPELLFSGEGDPGTPKTSTLVLTFDVDDDEATIVCTINEVPTPCAEPSIVDTITNDSTIAIDSMIQIVATDRADNPSQPLSFMWTFATQSISSPS